MSGPSPYVDTDAKFEDSLRPGSFDEFIGQKKTLQNLQIAIKAARKRKESLDHVLFSGLPGLGKTTLARIIAFEMKSMLHTTSGPVLKRPGDLVGTLTKGKTWLAITVGAGATLAWILTRKVFGSGSPEAEVPPSGNPNNS